MAALFWRSQLADCRRLLPMSEMTVFRHFTKSLAIIAIMLASVWPVCAQYESQYRRGTPPQFEAGASPLSSYTSPDIGVVGLVNGGLNFNLPMGEVGGRGFSF